MFIKPLSKYNKTTKERYSLFQLCESFRFDGRVRYRVIIGLGKLEELPADEQKMLLGRRIEDMLQGKSRLPIEQTDEKVEQLARHFYSKIVQKRRYDVKTKQRDWQIIDTESIKNKEAREIGAEWLCKQAFDQLKIEKFLRQIRWSEEDIALATTHIISRTVYPASELKTVKFIKENSAVTELTGYAKCFLQKVRKISLNLLVY